MQQNRDQSDPANRADDREQLTEVAMVVRAHLQSHRSDKLLRLFDYLLAKSLEGQFPSEQQIASEAFVGDSTDEGKREANVRVYAHRLRKLIDSMFAGKSGARIEIPVGAYRIQLVDDERVRDTSPVLSKLEPFKRSLGRLRRSQIVVLAFGFLLLVAIAFALYDRDTSPLSRTAVWRPFADTTRPLTLVVGDYYLFGSLGGPKQAANAEPRLIWDRSVPTREDLTIFQIMNPTAADETVDYNQQLVSGGTINALSDIRRTISEVPAVARSPLHLIAGSQLTPEILKDSDVIYIGQLSGMPALLRDPLAQASGYEMPFGFYAITDGKSAKTYQSDGMTLTDDRVARRDFAYLSGFSGPAGNRILIVAGLGDAGVKEAAAVVSDPGQLNAIKNDAAQARNGFEALYRVRTIRNVNVGATIVQNRALQSKGMWDNSDNVQKYRPIEINPVPPGQP